MIKRTEKKMLKQEKIVKAAAEVLSNKGFRGTLMAEIAIRAEVGKGTLYEYFKNKDDLFFAVFEWFTDQMKQRALVSLTELKGSAGERLVTVGKSFMNEWVETRDMFTLFLEFWSASASGSPSLRMRFRGYFKEMYAEFREIIASLVREGIERGEFQPDADPQAIAAVLAGGWDALLLQAWFDEDFNPAEALQKFYPVLYRGMSGRKFQDNGGDDA